MYTKGPAEARSQKAAKGDRGGGGGGLYIDGGGGDQCVGGKSFKNGGEGGTFSNACGANGGFGGGGGSLYEGKPHFQFYSLTIIFNFYLCYWTIKVVEEVVLVVVNVHLKITMEFTMLLMQLILTMKELNKKVLLILIMEMVMLNLLESLFLNQNMKRKRKLWTVQL